MRLSGTSMAAGVVSGMVAVILQNNQNLTPNALKMVLQYSSIPVKNDDGTYADVLTQGAGSVNASGAITLARAINPALALGEKWLTARRHAEHDHRRPDLRLGAADGVGQPHRARHGHHRRAAAVVGAQHRLGRRPGRRRQHRLGQQRRRQHRLGQPVRRR